MKKVKIYLISMIFFIVLGFVSALYLNHQFSKKEVFLDNLVVGKIKNRSNGKTMKKLILTNLLVENISQKKELITMEVNLREDVLWDTSFTDFDIFKKEQRITFFAIGRYVTDLNQIKKESINFDISKNTLSLYIERPKVSSVTIEDDKTIIYEVDKGILRFGEIKVTADEQNEVSNKVKEEMLRRMNEKELTNQAEDNTVKVLTEIIQTFLASSGFENVNVSVYLK